MSSSGRRNPSTPGTAAPRPTPETAGPRPARLTAAACLAGLEALALFAVGVYLLVAGLSGKPDDPGQAEALGVTVLVIGLLPLIAARGLFRLRGWSRGPAMITHVIGLPIAYALMSSGGALVPVGIAVAAVAVAGLVLLVNPATTAALGIRPPGTRENG
ncbi:hypothetical protein [Streptomyces montanisoli]|uniref:Integral membrane protein n=1 Tax=Streptomyces montanisoli TaxID=2798581 RepID=A0A940M9U6_9ACTN|nr:hypothetical protein [Streptomyces montanisoli]MBP0458955.1 hypothetical protein [Streptomyces montanisoli]